MNNSDRYYVAFWGCLATGMACPQLWVSMLFGVMGIASLVLFIFTKD